MLYLGSRNPSHSFETQRALHAADGYLFLGLPTEALAELDAVPPGESDEPAVMLARNRALLHLARWEDVEALSRKGAKLHPDAEEFTVQLAFSLQQQRRVDLADRVLSEAPVWIRRTGILHYNLACYEARLGDLDQAKRCIAAAIEMNSAIKKNARNDPDLAGLWN